MVGGAQMLAQLLDRGHLDAGKARPPFPLTGVGYQVTTIPQSPLTGCYWFHHVRLPCQTCLHEHSCLLYLDPCKPLVGIFRSSM